MSSYDHWKATEPDVHGEVCDRCGHLMVRDAWSSIWLCERCADYVDHDRLREDRDERRSLA